MKAAVIIFPGSNRERDVCAALKRASGLRRRFNGESGGNCESGAAVTGDKRPAIFGYLGNVGSGCSVEEHDAPAAVRSAAGKSVTTAA